jgi:thimet oligopeptidase
MPRVSRSLFSLGALTCALALAGLPAQAADGPATDPLHAWVGGSKPAALESWVNARLAAAQSDLDKLLAVKGKRTVENTLRPFDDAQNELAIAGNEAYIMYAVGKPAALRDKAQALSQKVAGVAADLALNQRVYKALSAVPLPAVEQDHATRHYLERTLLEYRLAGVDQNDATRARIKGLQDRITELSLQFGRNVQDGVNTVKATRAELDGLPEDYIARHKPDADGNYTLNTDAPDSSPVLDFANNAGLRHRMYLAYNNRAYPANKQVLLDLLAARQELAGILGYPNFAELATADQMIGNAAHVRELFDQVGQASRESRDKEYAQLLAFARKSDPTIEAIPQADSRYWEEQYRRANYSFDAQSVRPYFAYGPVETGILGAAAKIFHVEFKAVKDAPVWDPSVTVYDVLDQGKKVGRIYLDMHPREGKDKWFSATPVLPGIRGRQIPEGLLICNFSGGVAGDPGLMQYDEVVTYFHEFGHLMHHILGSQNRWSGQGGFNVEGDFVEAPSQMLEEFFRSRDVLAPFARHYKTGEVIPTDVMARMTAASAFARGYWTQRQLYYASYSLALHDRPVDKVDLDGQLHEASARFSPFAYVEGDHMYTGFTHLTGYASNYYTYVLDKVIALDFFAQFDRDHLLDGPAAMRYRKSVIEPGATKPAAELVRDFLGRPQGMGAIEAWINEQYQPAAKQ